MVNVASARAARNVSARPDFIRAPAPFYSGPVRWVNGRAFIPGWRSLVSLASTDEPAFRAEMRRLRREDPDRLAAFTSWLSIKAARPRGDAERHALHLL